MLYYREDEKLPLYVFSLLSFSGLNSVLKEWYNILDFLFFPFVENLLRKLIAL